MQISMKTYIAIVFSLLSTHSFATNTPVLSLVNKAISTPTRAHQHFLPRQTRKGEFLVEFGGFYSTQGKNMQPIAIEGLKGNLYTVTNHGHGSNGMVGLGYYLKGWHSDRFSLSYGIHTVYFGPSVISGNVIEEMRFANLAYQYEVHHFPLYVAAKGKFNNQTDRYALVLDAGMGPNFTKTSHYQEKLLGPFLLNNSFVGQSNIAFSAMAGIGFRINHLFGAAPLECGYRFHYLGEDALHPSNDQVLTKLYTGNNYAQAITCGIVI